MNKNNFLFVTSLAVAIILSIYLLFFKSTSSNSTNKQIELPTATPSMESKSLNKPELTIDQKKSYSAVLHTSVGDITIEFDTNNTPITSNNFINLAKNNFYDNTIFHRTLEDFMIQGGDPTGSGAGGPGYKFNDEYLKGSYTRGTVAMANAGPNTNGSQFFIMHKDNDLPNLYVIFGHVIEGMDTVDKIATAPVTNALGGEPSKPVTPVKILTVDILEK